MNVTPRFAVCLILPLLLLLALPLPLHAEKPDQPQTIRALAKAGKAIYAAGDGGTVLRSSDGGASWTALSGGRGANFQAVVAEGDQAWLLGGRGIEGHPTRWGQGMLLVATAGADSVSRRKLDQAGWLYGGTLVGPLGVLLGQANPLFPGGAIRLTQHDHLAKIDTPQQGPFLGGVFATPQTGYAVGPDLRVLDIRQLGFLLVQPERLASSSSLRTAAIGQDGRVWAAGDNGAVLHSQATGQNWTQPNLSLPMGTTRLADFSALTVDGQRIWIGGGFLGSILYSDTNGARFELRKAPGPVTALLHVEDDILIAAGPAGRIWRSDDAGRSWKQTYGPERLDVLIIATPWQRSALTAVAATHISGARAGILWTALQPDDPYVPGDQALRAAAIAAGACQVQAISEFTSPTLQGEGDRLEQADILQLWRRRIDADPTEELALQLAAAIRLYRPRVLVLPPQKGPKTGTGAEAALLGQIAIAAAELASRTTGDRNLSAIGLDPFTPDRIFWALPDNEQSARPWALPARDSRADLVIDSTKYPAELGTNLEMLALRAVSLLGDAGPVRRPSLKPAWKRLGPGGQVDLFTTGLLPARLDEKVNPPDGQANGEVADAVAVRRALLRNNLAGALGEATRQARTGGR
ncbi:MAG: WD40/YVTN/BNR-like repeat-containing protein, partial [Planctomycetota bacterium]